MERTPLAREGDLRCWGRREVRALSARPAHPSGAGGSRARVRSSAWTVSS